MYVHGTGSAKTISETECKRSEPMDEKVPGLRWLSGFGGVFTFTVAFSVQFDTYLLRYGF